MVKGISRTVPVKVIIGSNGFVQIGVDTKKGNKLVPNTEEPSEVNPNIKDLISTKVSSARDINNINKKVKTSVFPDITN